MPFRHICEVHERKTGLVDLAIDNQPGNDYFTLTFCDTVDGSYAGTTTVYQNQGATSASVVYNPAYTGYGVPNTTRFIFVPDDISQDDSSTFWVLVTVHAGSSAGAQLPFPVIPPLKTSRMPFIVKATAPSGADISSSMQILFPMVAESISVENLSTSKVIMLGFQPVGSEISIPAQGATIPPIIDVKGLDRVFIRGVSGTASFVLTANLSYGSWTY